MKMKQIIYILTAVMAVFLLTACDYLLPLPLGRDNPADDGSQIGKFRASVSGTTSVNTIWYWHSPSLDTPADQVIDKIRIVHKENDPPSSMNPLDKKEYVDIDTASTWEFQWENLKQGREHYFALYSHEKGGSWLAPKYSKVQLDYTAGAIGETLFTDSPSDDPRSFQVFSVDAGFAVNDETLNSNFTLTPGNYLVLKFNMFRYVYITQFLFHLKNIVPGSDVNLSITPIKKSLGDIADMTDFLSSSVLDYDHEISRQVLTAAGGNQSIELGSFPNRMFVYDVMALVIAVDNQLTLDISNWGIDLTFWGEFY